MSPSYIILMIITAFSEFLKYYQIIFMQNKKSVKNLTDFFYKNSFKITNNIAPGIPKRPTNMAVNTFNPIWKENIWPIKLIINRSNPPKIEFPISFRMLFRGNIKILPKRNKNIIQAK